MISGEICCPIARRLTPNQEQMLAAVIEAGQTHILEFPSYLPGGEDKLKNLLDQLWEVEQFYAPIGGVLGYVKKAEALLEPEEDQRRFTVPEAIDISQGHHNAMLHALAHWDEMVEIYPVGGAADRLQSGLPAARLNFAGKPLLSGMIRDLEAREYLHAKLFGKKVVTPIVLMTSQEKDNDTHVRAILEENDWFGRPQDSIHIMVQPLVPMMDREGKWLLNGPLDLTLKPGGHGVIWQLMLQEGVFDWLKGLGKKYAFLRQINNPMASLDGAALAFLGIGQLENKAFGFASCPRVKGVAEGINVVADGAHLTNVECGDIEGDFPANTNILFAHLESAREAVKALSLPGLLLNFRDDRARLESMMQNLADVIPLRDAYLTLNHRHKTISTTKKKFLDGQSRLETPENCFLDLMRNAHELLKECAFEVGEESVFLYHPALGPLYSIVRQKMRGGKIGRGSELMLELADVDIENLQLDGSLLVEAQNLDGAIELSNVSIKNQGVACGQSWQHSPERTESLHIRLAPGSSFIAENVTIEGGRVIDVPEGMCYVLDQDGFRAIPREPGPFWNYVSEGDEIRLARQM